MRLTSAQTRRFLAAVVLIAAFAAMASIFTPDRTRAADPQPVHDPIVNAARQPASANAHDGLMTLGMLEGGQYTLHIFAGDSGARYSVYESATGREVGTLLTPQQVHLKFPEINLPAIDFTAGETEAAGGLMLAEPRDSLQQ